MKHYKVKGFTLLETMLVLAIMSGILVMGMNYSTRQMDQLRRDKTAMQMQQILNAALAYYTAYGSWPIPNPPGCGFNSTGTTDETAWYPLNTLQTAGYISASLSKNPYGQVFHVNCDQMTNGNFYVLTQINNRANALAISGILPISYLSDGFGILSTTNDYVVAGVSTPGQNLNNARSVNFAGIYHHGACVPVPNCPGYNASAKACTDGSANCMTPQIMVSPVSVNGVDTASPPNLAPISGFTAYASGPPATSPLDCPTGATQTTCVPLGPKGIASPSGLYWRVCLQVITPSGSVAQNNAANTGTAAGVAGSAWGQYATLMAVTRCTPPSEPSGSDFSVFTP